MNIEYLHSLYSQLDSSLQIQPCMHLNSLTKLFLNFVSSEEEGWIQIVDAICSHCRSEIGEKGEWVHWGRYLLLQTTISDVSQYIHNISKIYSQSILSTNGNSVIDTKSKYSWKYVKCRPGLFCFAVPIPESEPNNGNYKVACWAKFMLKSERILIIELLFQD